MAAKKSALQRYDKLLEAKGNLQSSNNRSVNWLDAKRLENYRNACERILCPDQLALALTEKPTIPACKLLKYFEIPEYLVVDPTQPIPVILETICAFCDRINYPVMVKASVNGAEVCSTWSQVVYHIMRFLKKLSNATKNAIPLRKMVRHEICFVQKVIVGSEKTIAFAAVNGELTGCIQITKTNVTIAGKVWSAMVEGVSREVMEVLSEFVKACNWTGGGELEFIERFTSSLQFNYADQSPMKPWYMIDFNPRFPAWIHGGVVSGCNLPGDLIEHALFVNDRKLHNDGNRKWSLDKYMNLHPAAFSRTVVEQPVANIDKGQATSSIAINVSSMKSTRNNNNSNYHGTLIQEESCDSAIEEAYAIASKPIEENFYLDNDCIRDAWWKDIQRAANSILELPARIEDIQTPTYLLSSDSILGSLRSYKQLIEDAARDAESKFVTEAEESSIVESKIQVQMCLSVKTQPHAQVLKLGRKEGYFAECISLAEVRAALQTGYRPDEIILTGPGKFWEAYNDPYEAYPVYEECKSCAGGLSLKAIFADSISDLKHILQRLNDPKDFLRAEIVGIRFQPLALPSRSRFGVDGSNPCVVQEIVKEIRTNLPKHVRLGAHLHFASSAPNMGQKKWLSIAKATVLMAMDVADRCGKDLAVMDFGGGWLPHMVEDHTMQAEMQSLMQSLLNKHREACYRASPLIVMFELGKCISERAGGVLSRVLEIREIELEGDASNHEKVSVNVKRHALILDTTIAEVSVPHIHPLFWRPVVSNQDSVWSLLSRVGSDELWGRTCMEFDVLVGNTNGWGSSSGTCGLGEAGLSLPKEIKAGDFILIGGCGAYDMSMQYDFGDGKSRTRCLMCPSSV